MSVLSDCVSTGEEWLWLWEQVSRYGVYSRVCSLETRDSEMLYGKQMSSCWRDTIFPVSYIFRKTSACLPRLLSVFLTNQLPNTVNVPC